MIAVIDYGMGNLRSVANALEAVGGNPKLTVSQSDLREACGIVLPGVGAFCDGMRNLVSLNLIETLEEQVLHRHKPFLGICLGMQFLAERSFENGDYCGLGWLRATVERISPSQPKFKVPHMGWNDIQIQRPSELLENIETPVFYFLHSYYLKVNEGDANVVTSTCWHGESVTATIQWGNIFGVQFHPEKSQKSGLQILQNFRKLAGAC